MKTTSLVCGSLVALGFSAGLALTAAAAPLQLVASTDPGAAAPTVGGGASMNPIHSPDGRYVLFASSAENLVASSSNCPAVPQGFPRLQVYLRDRLKQTTTLVSVNAVDTGACQGDCLPTGLSTNGQYALFESSASDLVACDTNRVTDVFLRDLLHGTTRLVSVSTNGSCVNGFSGQSVMTPDGRFVAFVSAASDLVPGDTNGAPDVFVRDMHAGQTSLASPGVTPGSWSSDAPQITPDGRYVAFLSSARNLVPGVSTLNEVYVRDLVDGVTWVASTNAHRFLSGTIFAYNHAISDDGQFVAFEASSDSSAPGMIFRYNSLTRSTDRVCTNAIGTAMAFKHFRSLDMTPDGRFITFVGKTNSTSQVYVWDSQSATTILASATTNNTTPVNGLCDWPMIDSTGQFVAFLSTATNLATNWVAEGFHLYVRDLQAGTTRLVDTGLNGGGTAKELLNAPRLTPGGRFLAFESSDADLILQDCNEAFDVFVRDLALNSTELISQRADTLPSQTLPGAAARPLTAVSTQGRYVAFVSKTSTFLPDCTNANRGVFVHDLLQETNLLVSVDTNGLGGANDLSMDPVLSADGRLVAFASRADNLVGGDTNKTTDVFVRDVSSGVTSLVSINKDGAGPGNGASFQPLLSANGRVVLFRSRASNLTSGTFVTGSENLFWRDLTSATTYALSSAGISCAAMTSDGRFVAFGGRSAAMFVWDAQARAMVYTNSTPVLSAIAISPDGSRVVGMKNGQLYAADRVAGTNWLLLPALAAEVSHPNLQFSADGQLLVYATAVAQGPLDTNGVADVYLYDFVTQRHLLVSQAFGAAVANGPSDAPVLSADGRFVAYCSAASNLVPGDANEVPDVFLYDRQIGATTLLSASSFGAVAGNNRSFAPAFSPDGQTLVFQSWASDLAAQDFNQGGDLFVLKLAVSNSTPVFKGEIVFAPAAGQPATLTWPATWGKAYRVQFKGSLTDPTWQDLNGKVSVVGSSGYAADLAPSPRQRFYRIVAF